MSAPIPTSEPTQIRVGETLTFSRCLANFPASDGWSIQYSFVSSANDLIQFTSTASGSTHLVTVAASTTSGWVAADYFGTGLAVKSGEKYTVFEGWLKVKPDLTALTADQYDQRSQARRTLDNINAVLEGRATHDILKSTIEGTVIERLSLKELLDFKSYYCQIVMNEQARADSAAGKPNSKTILLQFSTR